MTRYDKELDSRTEEWEKAAEPLQKEDRKPLRRPDDPERRNDQRSSEDDQSAEPDSSSK